MLGEEVKGEGMEEVRARSPGQAGKGPGRQNTNKGRGGGGLAGFRGCYKGRIKD